MYSLSRDIPPFSHAAKLKLEAAVFNTKKWGQHGCTILCVSNASPITQALVGKKIYENEDEEEHFNLLMALGLLAYFNIHQLIGNVDELASILHSTLFFK
ncbi:hypothetical protein EGR_06496 [Echinococcus granulosus]|uniref:Uncharacterized protein n=1 Tax=Echinococcus granulosus TaxID=6210 RepID=W6UB52_ECHGR|nr:hypothetical protein EGR_06496 [Echinococcus granulosus]EUB58613.1 hypothetical protein EGR_06496 [Echinococcus granulosus]